MEKICRICSTERQYDENHRLYKRCNRSNARCSLKYSIANIDKGLEKRKKIIILKEKKFLIQR